MILRRQNRIHIRGLARMPLHGESSPASGRKIVAVSPNVAAWERVGASTRIDNRVRIQAAIKPGDEA